MEMIIYWTREEATGDLFVWFCFFCCSCCFFNYSSSCCFELLELLELVFELLELAAGATWAKTLQRPSTMGCDCARAVPRYLLVFPLQDLSTLYLYIFLYPSSATSSEPCKNWPKICSIWWMKKWNDLFRWILTTLNFILLVSSLLISSRKHTFIFDDQLWAGLRSDQMKIRKSKNWFPENQFFWLFLDFSQNW